MFKFFFFVLLLYVANAIIPIEKKCILPKKSPFNCEALGDNWHQRQLKNKRFCIDCNNSIVDMPRKRISCDDYIESHKIILRTTLNECKLPLTPSPTTLAPTSAPTTPPPTQEPYLAMFKLACNNSKNCSQVRWHPKMEKISRRGQKLCITKKNTCVMSKEGIKLAKKLENN